MGYLEAQALFLSHEVQLIAKMDPIKYLLEKSALTERLVRWQSFLSQFEITYVAQKAIKGYTIAKHLAHLPLPVFNEINSEFPDEDLMTIQDPRDLVWSLYFDRESNEYERQRNRSGAPITGKCSNPSSLPTHFSCYQ